MSPEEVRVRLGLAPFAAASLRRGDLRRSGRATRAMAFVIAALTEGGRVHHYVATDMDVSSQFSIALQWLRAIGFAPIVVNHGRLRLPCGGELWIRRSSGDGDGDGEIHSP